MDELESQRYTKKEFESLSKEDKRLLIIQDALDSVTMEIVKPARGNYVHKIWYENSIKSIKENPKISCEVCELGALLISTCRFVNELTYDGVNALLHKGAKFKNFNKLFSNDQLILIESCFEGSFKRMDSRYGLRNMGLPYYNYEYNGDVYETALEYFELFPDATDRMVAIFINMIYNDGIFIPEQDLD